MAISDSEKLDLLWKKVGFGVSKTATAANKAGSNETVASPLPVYASNIWTDTGSIPAVAPATATATVGRLYGVDAIRMTNDGTSAPNLSWIAHSTYNDVGSARVTDFIPATFGSSYSVKVYIGNPNTNAARIFPDTNGEEWVFDYVSGVLNFIGGIPAAKSATIGSGTMTVAGNGIYIEVYRYIGNKGVAASGATSKNYVVANIAARDALTGLTAGDIVHVQDASGIASHAGAGEYANYMWSGAGFVLFSTQDSARTDALTSSITVTSASADEVSFGRVGNGVRIVTISVEVVTPFDGDREFAMGDATVGDRLADDAMVDLQTAGTYVINPTYQFPANAETEVLVGLAGTSTVGEALITVTYA